MYLFIIYMGNLYYLLGLEIIYIENKKYYLDEKNKIYDLNKDNNLVYVGLKIKDYYNLFGKRKNINI